MPIITGDVVKHTSINEIGRACRETPHFWYVHFRNANLGCRRSRKTSLIKEVDQHQSVPACGSCGN